MVLDGGSQLTFIKESVSRRLKLRVAGTHKLSVFSFGNTKQPVPRVYNKVLLNLQGQHDSEVIKLFAVQGQTKK